MAGQGTSFHKFNKLSYNTPVPNYQSSVTVSTSISSSWSCVESAALSDDFPASFECRHFILLFWNQTFTWASVRPNVAANCLLSGFVIYF